MAQDRGPQFQFYQAPPGPDASRQYSDQVQAILAQGDAISKPLLMLMQNLAAKQGQQREIAARRSEQETQLNYQKSRDVVRDAQFQQEQALRQSSENRQNEQDLYRRNQDVTDLDMTIAGMTPPNYVEKTDPMLDRLVQLRSGMQAVPNSPMPQAGPHAEFLDQFMRTQQRQQEQAAKQQALQAQFQNTSTLIDNAAANKTITPAQATAFKMRLNDEVGLREVGGEVSKLIGDAATRAGGDVAFEASLKGLEKSIKTDFPDSAEKQGQIASFRTLMEHSSLPPDEKMKLLAERQKEIYGVGKSTTPKGPTIEIPGLGTFDVPAYVAKGGAGDGMPKEVTNWIHSLAVAAANKDPRFGQSELGAANRSDPAKFDAAVQEYEAPLRERVMADYGWSVNKLPYSNVGDVANSAETSQAPAQQAAAPQQAQASNPIADIPDDVVKAMHDAKAQGPEAVKAVLKNAIEADRKRSSLPENAGAVGSEFLKKDPEPKWWWAMNSAYAPMLKQYDGNVEKAHAAWLERWAKHFGGKEALSK